MGGKVPVKTITANGGEEYKINQIPVRQTVQQEPICLIGHQNGTNSNKEITVNKKLPDFLNNFQVMNQGFLSRIAADSL